MRYMIYGGVILFICLPLILTTGPVGLAITFLVSWILGKILGADVSINDRISDVETKVREADRRAKEKYVYVPKRTYRSRKIEPRTWTLRRTLCFTIAVSVLVWIPLLIQWLLHPSNPIYRYIQGFP